MTSTPMLNRLPLRDPPRIDESRLSQLLKDLFASWRKSLEESFKGLTENGETDPGLFPLRSSGVFVQPVTAAANAFLSSLDPEQRATVGLPIDSEVWRPWGNINRNLMRHGLLPCGAERPSARVGIRADACRAGHTSL